MAEETTTVRDLARKNDEDGTIGGEKADLVWEAACDNLEMSVTEFCESEIGVQVSETHVRNVLKTLSPGAFGL